MTTLALFLTLSAHGGFAGLALLSMLVVGIVGAPGGDGGAGDGGGGGDDGAGDGGGDAGEQGDGDAGDDGADPQADRRAAGDDDDADLTDEEREREELLNTLTPEERAKRARTWNRRTSRQLRAIAPIAERFRGKDGRYLTVDEIDRIRNKAADQEEIEAFYAEHPDLLQEMLKRKNGARTEPAAAAAFVDPFANEADLPFDTTSPEGKWFVEQHRRQARENFELKQTLTRLEQALGGVHERDTQRSLAQAENTWKTETLAAAKTAGLAGDDLQDFVNGVYANFRLARAEKRLDKVDRKQIIERALRPFKRNRTAGTRQAAAGAHQRAAHNTGVPRPGNRGAAGPANPQDTNRPAGTIKDARKGFFARVGMSAPPGGR